MSTSKASKRRSTPWNPGSASLPCSRLKTAPTAPSARCITCCRKSASPSCAARASASATSSWQNPARKQPTLRKFSPTSRRSASAGRYLSALSGKEKITPCANTALAAKMVAESADSGAAAICSHACAELYGLETLSDDIQDSDNNYTRFYLRNQKARHLCGRKPHQPDSGLPEQARRAERDY